MGQKLFSKCHSEFSIDIIRLEFDLELIELELNSNEQGSRPTKFYKIGFFK